MVESTPLSEDLLVEILSRLSVRILVRLTCVCKQWLSLISSPSFAKKQLATARAMLFKDNFQFFLTSRMLLESGVRREHASLLSYRSFQLDAKFEFTPCYYIAFSEPCDGIICVFVKRDVHEASLVLWNPAIREMKLLPFPVPPSILQQTNCPKLGVDVFGFGYDPKPHDYKVFVIFSPCQSIIDDERPTGIYTLREDSWKFLPTDSYHESMHSARGVFERTSLNGNVCNWLKDSCGDSLISFDLTNEVFLKTPLHERCIHPDFGPVLLQSNKIDALPRVMCCHHPSYLRGDRNDIEIWELAEYGLSGCWTKQIVIEFQYYESMSFPLGYWRDEETLILEGFDLDEDNLVIERPLHTYNAHTKQLKSAGFEKTFELLVGRGYIESLVSINRICKQHNIQEQLQQDESGITGTFSLCEVNDSVSSRNTFQCYDVPWCYL